MQGITGETEVWGISLLKFRLYFDFLKAFVIIKWIKTQLSASLEIA